MIYIWPRSDGIQIVGKRFGRSCGPASGVLTRTKLIGIVVGQDLISFVIYMTTSRRCMMDDVIR